MTIDFGIIAVVDPSVVRGGVWGRTGLRSASPREEGYVAVDALVALTILTSTIVFALSAVQQGARVARSALEVREASAELQEAMQWTRAGVSGGQVSTHAFSSRVELSPPTQMVAGIGLCRRTVVVVSAQSGRPYYASTNAICIAGAQS